MGSTLALGLGLGITAVFSAMSALLLVFAIQAQSRKTREPLFEDRQNATIFLFDGDVLVDCTPGARAMLAASPAAGGPWPKMIAQISGFFPEASRHLDSLSEAGAITLEGEDGDGLPMLLRAELRGGLTRIVIHDSESGQDGKAADDPMIYRAMTEELAILRSMLTQAPIMAWREREDGGVIWANTEYVLAAADQLAPGQELGWPLPRLFGRIATSQGVTGQRQKIDRADGTARWFELTVVAEGEGRRVFALPCDAAVAAETSLRDFTQTLTKTFAHLPTGLAIFDRDRKLQLFNPALVDLTGLPPDYLSSRPSVVAMLDMMRDRSMVPEPKDYRRWRHQLVEMQDAPPGGVHEEIWTLAGGQTYRVTGRPQSNGSLALMFEDISNEVSRNQRYRADLELGQSVIDAMDEAVAVFSETGSLVMLNRAYADLWGSDPSESLADAGIRGILGEWAALCAPSTLWSEIGDFVATIGDREGWVSEVRLLDGRLLQCRLHPISGGATMIGFRPVASALDISPVEPTQRKRRA